MLIKRFSGVFSVKCYLVPLSIVFLALFLRLFRFPEVPPSLNWDEVSHGYNAYSLLKTGKDEWGETLPVIFRAYGDYKLPLYIYLTSLVVAVFGLSEFSVRLVSLVAGVSLVVLTYFLAKELFDEKVGVLSSLLVAVEPWSLFLSRGAFEANLAVTLMVGGILFFLKGVQKSPGYLALSSLLFGLSVWTYNSARVFVPVLILQLVVIYFIKLRDLLKKNKGIFILPLCILAIAFIPMIRQLFLHTGQARYQWVAIIDQGAIARINELRFQSTTPLFARNILYNKITYFSFNFIVNWLKHFSPDFIFLQGGSHYQFSVPERGLIYLVNLPLVLLGFYKLFKRRTPSSFLLLGWFFLAPIPSSLTREAPHVLRSIVFLPTPMVITAVGMICLVDLIKRYKGFFVGAYLIVLGFSLLSYLKEYFGKYRLDYSWAWQYGYKDAVITLKSVYPNYDKIYFSKKYGEPHEFILFYWPWNPSSYRSDVNLVRYFRSNWYWVDSFDKFIFLNDWEVKEKASCNLMGQGACLLVTSPGNSPKGWSLTKTFYFLDGKAAFEFYEKQI